MDELEWERRLSHVEDRAKSNTHRLDEVEKEQHQLGELVTSMSVMAQRMDTTEQAVGEIKQDVKMLVNSPRKWWETAVKTAITVLVTALVTYLISSPK